MFLRDFNSLFYYTGPDASKPNDGSQQQVPQDIKPDIGQLQIKQEKDLQSLPPQMKPPPEKRQKLA